MPLDPVTTRPLELVSTRALTAEACASSALALMQHPALWTAMHTIGCMLEARAHNDGDAGRIIAQLLEGADMSEHDAIDALALMEAVDRTARTWAHLAHPGCRDGVQAVPHLGIVR